MEAEGEVLAAVVAAEPDENADGTEKGCVCEEGFTQGTLHSDLQGGGGSLTYGNRRPD